MSAVLSAFRQAGIQPVENSQDCDAALIWSVLWSGRMASNRMVYEHYRSLGRPVVIIDIGALHRGRTWKVSVDHVNALGYYGHDIDLDPDRPRQLGIAPKAPATRLGHIIVATQHHSSLQWQGQPAVEIWVQKQVQQIRKHTDRPIKIRPHPRCSIGNLLSLPDVEIQRPQRRPDTYDDFDMDLSCYAVINHNSGPGIQAGLALTPIIVDQSSLAWPVSISMVEIENPPQRDHDQWLLEICHTEYTMEELEQGRWRQILGARL